MKVESLTLRNFRNVQECTLRPERHLNFLIGKNGQGKTSFLEALSFLATLRSFRGAKTEEVIHWGEKEAELTCKIVPDAPESAEDWRTELKVALGLEPKATKLAFINGKPYRSAASYLTQRFGQFELGFHTIVFNPSDHDLVRGEPSIRRHYLDRVLAGEDLEYLKAYQKYQRTLAQRNALLRGDTFPSRDLLRGFTEPLAELGAVIVFKRLQWLNRLIDPLRLTIERIAPKQPALRLFYLSNWIPRIHNLSLENNKLHDAGIPDLDVHFAGQAQLPSVELLEQAFWKQLSLLEEAERRAQSSLVGPHRDDWAFLLGTHVLKGHGSQGEVRSALLALKLSEIELFRGRTGHQPLLLLDDFSSELDQERRAFLLRYLTETDLQVFVTTTEDFIGGGKRFWVSQGRLTELANELKDEREQVTTHDNPTE